MDKTLYFEDTSETPVHQRKVIYVGTNDIHIGYQYRPIVKLVCPDQVEYAEQWVDDQESGASLSLIEIAHILKAIGW